MNHNIVLIVGKSTSGKSASLMGLKDPEGVLYLNTENNKALPFPAKFYKNPKTNETGFNITHPNQVYKAFEFAETKDEIHTIVIDSLTYLMEMYETKIINTAADTRSAWGHYATYFKNLMFEYVAKSSKRVIFLAHTANVYNENEMVNEVIVKVKGSLMNQGIESYFNTVVAAKKVDLNKLEKYQNPLLQITPQDEIQGYKHCFQTQITKDTMNERIRSSIGMWKPEETYIDNNAQYVLDRLAEFYQ